MREKLIIAIVAVTSSVVLLPGLCTAQGNPGNVCKFSYSTNPNTDPWELYLPNWFTTDCNGAFNFGKDYIEWAATNLWAPYTRCQNTGSQGGADGSWFPSVMYLNIMAEGAGGKGWADVFKRATDAGWTIGNGFHVLLPYPLSYMFFRTGSYVPGGTSGIEGFLSSQLNPTCVQFEDCQYPLYKTSRSGACQLRNIADTAIKDPFFSGTSSNPSQFLDYACLFTCAIPSIDASYIKFSDNGQEACTLYGDGTSSPTMYGCPP